MFEKKRIGVDPTSCKCGELKKGEQGEKKNRNNRHETTEKDFRVGVKFKNDDMKVWEYEGGEGAHRSRLRTSAST